MSVPPLPFGWLGAQLLREVETAASAASPAPRPFSVLLLCCLLLLMHILLRLASPRRLQRHGTHTNIDQAATCNACPETL